MSARYTGHATRRSARLRSSRGGLGIHRIDETPQGYRVLPCLSWPALAHHEQGEPRANFRLLRTSRQASFHFTKISRSSPPESVEFAVRVLDIDLTENMTRHPAL